MIKNILYISLLWMMISCTNTNVESKIYTITESHTVFDSSRNRHIPIEIYKLSDNQYSYQKLVLLNAGYGCSNTEYSFISKSLASKGYLVAATHHEQEADPFLPSGENMYEARLPNWTEGVKNLEKIYDKMILAYPTIDTQQLYIIGHSNGGDIALLFSQKYSHQVKSVITLDHRRMPIPRTSAFSVLSIRADEFEADEGVLPTPQEIQAYPIELVELKNVGHNYLRDNATPKTKQIVLNVIHQFLEK